MGAVVVLLGSRRSKRMTPLLLIAALGIGTHLAISQASLFDDAFISFRYARNFAEGHGLVWNLGEPVEGYTNFLWTVAIGLGVRFTGIDAAVFGLWGALAVFLANLLVVWRIGRLLCGPGHLAVAPLLLGAHAVFASFGTTGMETAACALAVDSLLWALLARDDALGAALAGTAGIVATLLRPDHALFYIAGSVVVAWAARRDLRRFLTHAAAYSVPFVGYLAYLAWKLDFYGEILPNTYYAKSAGLAWFSQGAVYAASFYLGCQAWIWLLATVWGARTSAHGSEARRFGLFFVVSFVTYNVYVAKVGGDFMYARFYIPLLPMLALGAEYALHGLITAERRVAAVALGSVLAIACVPIEASDAIGHRETGIRAQGPTHALSSLNPPVVHHGAAKVGRYFEEVFTDRGIEPTLAKGGIGMVGYYTRLPLVDIRGLTDPVVARMPLQKRTRPGHEKMATSAHLIEREVDLLRHVTGQPHVTPKRFREATQVKFGGKTKSGLRPGGRWKTRWWIPQYDAELWDRIAAEAPEVSFVHFPTWLDRWLQQEAPRRSKKQLQADLLWFRAYYFDRNDDPERLALVEAAVRVSDAP
jgi:arabinofuranosyltransferase